MSDHYTIKLADGKYTIIRWQQGAGGLNGLEFLRHGEPWPGAGDLRYANVVVAMHQRIEELEMAIGQVLHGTLDGGARCHDGLYEHGRGVYAERWIKTLHNVLEQK